MRNIFCLYYLFSLLPSSLKEKLWHIQVGDVQRHPTQRGTFLCNWTDMQFLLQRWHGLSQKKWFKESSDRENRRQEDNSTWEANKIKSQYMERKNVTFTSLDYYHYVQGRSYRVVPVVRGPPCAQPNQSSSVKLGRERSACVPLGLLRTAFRHRPSWEFAHSRRLRPAAPFYSSPCGHAVKPLGAGDAVRWRAQPSLIWDSTTANVEQLPS